MIPQRHVRYKQQAEHRNGMPAAVARAFPEQLELPAAWHEAGLRKLSTHSDIALLAEIKSHDGLTQHHVQQVSFGEQTAENNVEQPLTFVADFEPAPGDKQLIAIQIFPGGFLTEIVQKAVAEKTACTEERADPQSAGVERIAGDQGARQTH